MQLAVDGCSKGLPSSESPEPDENRVGISQCDARVLMSSSKFDRAGTDMLFFQSDHIVVICASFRGSGTPA